MNYRHTSNEPRAAWLRLVAAGGRILERSELGPDGPGVITVGTRTLSESGTVGQWDRQQVELFCISKLINCVLESDEEFIIMDFHFAVGMLLCCGGCCCEGVLLWWFLGGCWEWECGVYAYTYRAVCVYISWATLPSPPPPLPSPSPHPQSTYADPHLTHTGDGGLQSVLELLFLFLEQPRWEESAMERAKQMFVSHYRSLAKTLERATADRVVSAMMGPDRRVRDPTPEEIGALSLEAMQRAIMRQLQANNIEVTVVGDFDEQELLDGALRYLGCLTTHEEPPMRSYAPLVLQDPPMALRQQVWHLKVGVFLCVNGECCWWCDTCTHIHPYTPILIYTHTRTYTHTLMYTLHNKPTPSTYTHIHPHTITYNHIHPHTTPHTLSLSQDSDERAVAYIAGKAPSRWGSFGAPSGTPIPQQGQVQPPILLPANATPQVCTGGGFCWGVVVIVQQVVFVGHCVFLAGCFMVGVCFCIDREK